MAVFTIIPCGDIGRQVDENLALLQHHVESPFINEEVIVKIPYRLKVFVDLFRWKVGKECVEQDIPC